MLPAKPVAPFFCLFSYSTLNLNEIRQNLSLMEARAIHFITL